MNKPAFVFSVALTACILLLIGGVVTAFKYSQVKAAGTPAPAASSSADTAASSSVDPGIDPTAIQQAYAEREQAYQNLIAQANQRLDELQQSNQALQSEVNALKSSQNPVQDPAQSNVQAPAQNPVAPATVSPQAAAQIASSYIKRTDLYSVENASFNGASAYLVTFSSGDKVYVSMDGQVLSVQRAQGQIAMSNGGGGGGHEHEHEGGGDD